MRDYYEIFGVAPNATPEEIKERYRFLAHAYHPDKFSSEQHRQQAEQQFKEVNEAYETLKDSARRRSYDSTRAQNDRPLHPKPSPSSSRRRLIFVWFIAAAIVIACIVFIGPFHRPQPLAEFFAWEKTQQGQYKQVRKNYFMDEAGCKNVIDALNAMSTAQSPSNYILSHTTDSTFESWPASSPPSPRLQELSTYSDEPNINLAQ